MGNNHGLNTKIFTCKRKFHFKFFPSNLNSFNYILPKVLFICGGDEALLK